MLARLDWHTCAEPHSQRYVGRNLARHAHCAGEYVRLYELLHDQAFLAVVQRENYFGGHSVDDLHSWAYDGSHIGYYPHTVPPMPPLEAWVEPGSWFEITNVFFGGAADWRCNACGLSGFTGEPEGRPSDWSQCPGCGWKGNESERKAWLNAKAEVEKRRHTGEQAP